MQDSEFRSPGAHYRPAQRAADIRPRGKVGNLPFSAIVLEEIAALKERGFGGVMFTLHYENYLDSKDHWQKLRRELEEVRRLEMRAWLRDERGRPSGKAAGKVVARYPEGQATGLAHVALATEGPGRVRMFLPVGELVYVGALPWQGDHLTLDGVIRLEGSVQGGDLDATLPAGRWSVVALVKRRLTEGTFAHDLSSGEEPYINILDRQAVEIFLNVTYEAYWREVGDFFGNTVEGIQTDEPMLITTAFPVKTAFPPYPALPWLHDLPERFQARYGYDLVEHLPALCHRVGPQTARIRCDFYRLIGELCGQSYTQTLSDWCRAHGVPLKAQPLGEESLVAHTAFEGSIFSFLSPAEALCPDLLSTTLETFKTRDQCLPAPKMVSSVAHVHGRSRIVADFADYYQLRGGVPTTVEQLRSAIGWLYVLGANELLSLCDWRDHDPQVWRQLNDYAARLGVMLRGGSHIADLAVLYPITTIWAHYTPSTDFMMLPPIGSLERPKIWSESYAAEATLWELPFRQLVWSLLEHQRDFDLVDDEAVERAEMAGGRLRIADEAYRALVLPPMDVLDRRTLAKATALAEQGGIVIAHHPLPNHSAQSGEDRELRRAAYGLFGETVPLAGGYVARPVGAGKAVLAADMAGALAALNALIPADIHLEPATAGVFGLHRRRGEQEVYFLVNNMPEPLTLTTTLRARGQATVWNPLDGSIETVATARVDGGTRLPLHLDGYAGKFIVLAKP